MQIDTLKMTHIFHSITYMNQLPSTQIKNQSNQS